MYQVPYRLVLNQVFLYTLNVRDNGGPKHVRRSSSCKVGKALGLHARIPVVWADGTQHYKQVESPGGTECIMKEYRYWYRNPCLITKRTMARNGGRLERGGDSDKYRVEKGYHCIVQKPNSHRPNFSHSKDAFLTALIIFSPPFFSLRASS